jgi:arginine decarboxylase
MSSSEGQIRVFGSVAEAPTALAAFDRALQAGEVHDTNLVMLSSIIPPDTEVVRSSADPQEFTPGDRLWCVMAEERVTVPGTEAWAGLGWANDLDRSGGVFVEAHGHSERQVRFDLEASLATMIGDRPYWAFQEPEIEIVGATCEHDPICALVMAINHSEPWPGLPAR